MALSSPGIGSGLDIDGLIQKLMANEAKSLDKYDTRNEKYNTRLEAMGKVSGAVGAFQGSLSALSSASSFRAVSASVSDADVLKGTATSEAAAGTYRVNVTRLAQAQTLNSGGFASMTSMIGGGAKNTLTFQFGTSTGNFGLAGTSLASAIGSGGIPNGSLKINGTAIATSGATNSAKELAAAINAESAASGVTATAGRTETGATLFGGAGAGNFGNVTTGAASSYALSIGGVQIAAQGAGVAGGAGVSAASIDAALSGNTATTVALNEAGITFTGSAANGDLRFFAADGSNIAVTETVTGTVSGGIGNSGAPNVGSQVTATSGVTLTSSTGSAITIGGSNPALSGLTAGTGGSYLGGGFTQDGDKASGTVTLDAADQSLQGIRDAINRANIGVQASIVSDGSDKPYRLVLTSTKTGETSSMKISVNGENGAAGDPALQALLGYDPAGAQGLKQTSAAQNALLDVNGVAISSANNSVTGAIQGVTLDVAQTGKSNVTIAKDNASVKSSVDAFVKAYNDLNTTLKNLSKYDPETKIAGPLAGDSTVRSIQSQLRGLLGTTVTSGKLTSLSQVGITFQKDGNLAVDSGKFNKALTDNFESVSGLFAAVGNTSDSLIKFTSSTSKTQPGTYAVNITTPPSKGTLTSQNALAASTTIAPNTTWIVTLNQTDPVTSSKTANISLAAGTYTPDQLSAMVRAAINGNSGFMENGDAVETSLVDGKLALASTKWGEASNISIAGLTGSAVSDVFGTSEPVKGTDVAGTIGGAPATGNGKNLTGAVGSPAEGLALEITGGAAGERGTVSFTQGYAYQLNNLATSFMGKDGLITTKSEGLNTSIKSTTKERERQVERLTDMEKRYRAQFVALDAMLSSMQSTSNYLQQQLAALAANS